MALMFTGMSREAAKFQARSAFSGVGYTTGEAECVVNHPVRRRIVMLLMLLGNIGIAAVIATVMVSISSAAGASLTSQLSTFAMLLGGLLVLWLLSRSRYVERNLNKVIAWALRRFTDLDARDYHALLQLADGYAVSEMLIGKSDWVADKALHELRLSEEGILVLGIHNTSNGYHGIPRAEDVIRVGDTLILYGNLKDIHALDRRRAGSRGDREHETSVEQKQQIPQEDEQVAS